MSKPAYICPKCGYDQSGMIDSWTDRCPVRGRCAECGLEFAWADVFYPIRNTVWWYAEHSPSIWEMVRRTPGSIGRLVLPWKFWGQVDVSKPILLRRLWVWIFFVVILVHLLVSIPYGYGFGTRWRSPTLVEYFADYGFAGVNKILFNGLFHPVIETRFHFRGGVAGVYFSMGSSRQIFDGLIKPLAFQFGFLALWGVVLAVIPNTRRLAKIRRAHVIRALALSALLAFLTMEFFRFTHGLTMRFGNDPNLIRFLSRVIISAGIFWQVVFWASCILIGWRVRPWKLLVALGTLAALLGGFAFRMYLFLLFEGNM